MHRSKRKRNIIIFSLVGVLLCMVAGYAAFQTQLKVTGTSKVTSNWDIEITNVTEGTPTGSAENTVAPSWDKLWASMEANLYDKGDAMEYDVTIENKGTLDAKLNDIITNLENSNNEAVIITFSGYTKGEVLKSKATKVIHVKIEYNPEYEGGETSSEVEINFDYTQNNNEENNPDTQYLLTYDYQTNGGQSVELTEELISSGSNVDLSNTATKEGWKFVGWNTDKDAETGLKNYQMPTENTTLYAIYSKTLKVTYEKGDNIDSIGKNEDSCNIYNNGISCEITLPEITATDDSSIVGWYSGKDKIGNPNDKYTIDKDITLIAQAEGESYMMARDDNYAFWAEEYRTKIKTIDFVDNKNVPDNAVASWDVSDKKDKSVMAWIINDQDNSGYYKLYIGGTDGVIANENCSDFFDTFNEATTISLQNLNTSRVINMHDFFCDDWALENINFGNIDTSNVTNMSGMFGRCYAMKQLDLNSFDTRKVTTMRSMFEGCNNLINLNFGNFNTSNVTDMARMFWKCSQLKVLDLSNFKTNNVTDMSEMFFTCTNLTELDLSFFDTSSVTLMFSMFADCDNIIEINLNNFNTAKVTNMENMFANCDNIELIDVSNFDTSNVTNMRDMFSYNPNLEKIVGLENFDTSNVTNMIGMFNFDSSLKKLNLCSFDTRNVVEMWMIFRGTTNLSTIYVGPNWTAEKAEANGQAFDMFTDSAVSNVTQSDNCEYDAEDISLDISTTSTTNSITVVANADADSGIAKYEYSKDGGKTWEESTSNTYTFTGLAAGTGYDIKVRVTSNIEKTLEKGTNVNITDNVVTTGDGLYEDEYEEGRYIYRGSSPNNYIMFNDELWRIIAKEVDGTYKIIRNELLATRTFDESYHRTTEKNSYCQNPSNGCGVYAAVDGIFTSPNGSQSGTVTEDSSIKIYLNDDYYVNEINETAKNQMAAHLFNIGVVEQLNNGSSDSIEKNIAGEKMYTWSGNVGLVNISDILKASTNPLCTSASYSAMEGEGNECNSNYLLDRGNASESFYWTINAHSFESGDYSHFAWYGSLINSDEAVGGFTANATNITPRPVVFLKSSTTLSGTGSYDDPYQINKGTSTSTLEKPTFKEADTDNGKTVTITYPSGCGDSLTCTYQKDNGETVNVTSSTINVEFTDSGSLVANVSDGTNNVSSSYTVSLLPTVSFSETSDEIGNKHTLTMTFDDRCSSQYNCTYKIGNGNEVVVKHKTVIYEYYKTKRQTVTATISNGNDKTINTYDITNNVASPIPLNFTSDSFINDTNSDLIIGKSYINWSNSNSYMMNFWDYEPEGMSDDWQEMLNSGNFPELDSYSDYQMYPFGIRIYDLSQIEVNSESKAYLELDWTIDTLENASEYYLIYYSADHDSINIVEPTNVNMDTKTIGFSVDINTLIDNQYTTIMYLVYR